VPRKLIWPNHSDLAIRLTPTVLREEYLDHMTFRRRERPLFTEIFGPLVGLKEEWLKQGATPEELDLSAFRYRSPATGAIPVNIGQMGGLCEPRILDETDDYVLSRDSLGRTLRLYKGVATIPLPESGHPVKTMDDWRRLRHLFEFSPARLAGDWEATARAHLAAGRATVAGIPGGFDLPRQLMGEERACLAYYEQPELMHDILSTLAETAFRVLEVVSRTVAVDILSVHEDMAGKSGPLAGPRQVEAFIKPYYRRLWDLLAERGTRLFDQDSDGDMNAVIPAFLDAGVNCMHPMEPAANMDIVQVRQHYGTRLAFYGGIDKHVLRRSQAEIVAELEYKIPPMLATGGCVLGLDHRIPNGTPLANYRFYIAKVWEMLDREARAPGPEADG
jgi:uroporphyrinogen-III decarboxylase